MSKVLHSPPGSILSLLAFTASVLLAVAKLRLADLLRKARGALGSLWQQQVTSNGNKHAEETAKSLAILPV